MDTITALRERLLGQAYLFDQPEAYAAGVEDTLTALAHLRDAADEVGLTLDLTREIPVMRLTAN